MFKKYYLEDHPIPDGFQIYGRTEVVGIQHRRSSGLAFARSRDPWLEFEPEPSNSHDKNAIKIIGCSRGLFGTKKRFIGYIPRTIAQQIANSSGANIVRPRLEKIYVGDDGYLEIALQIIGPKEHKWDYVGSSHEDGSHYSEQVEKIKVQKARGDYDAAIALLLACVSQTEEEAQKKGWGVAPWYYEQLAIIYRKLRQFADEVAILKRYETQPKAPGVGPEKLAQRLVKAEALVARNIN